MSSLPPFQNEPILELRRASVRAQLADAMSALDDQLPLAVPVAVGTDLRAGEELPSTDPGEPERLVALAAQAAPREIEAAVALAHEGGTGLGRRAGDARPCGRVDRGGGVAARAPAGAGRARGQRMRQALAGGGRRRVRGDRLPRVLRPRGGRAGGRPRAAAGPRRAQRAPLRAARGDRGDLAVELPAGDCLWDDARPRWPPAMPSC